MKKKVTLSESQARGLLVLLQAKTWSRLASAGRETSDDYPWSIRVHSRVAKKLVAMGFAKERNVDVAGREVRGADLVHRLGEWSTEYEITARGERAWAAMSPAERYGLPERALPAKARGDTIGALTKSKLVKRGAFL